MKRRLVSLAVALSLLLAACAPALAEADWGGIWTGVHSGVVQVEGVTQSWSRETGQTEQVVAMVSGLYYGENYVLTCAHPLTGCDEVRVTDENGEVYRVTDRRTDETIDLTVLVLDRRIEGATALSLDGEASMLDEVMVGGHANAEEGILPYTETRGIVSGLNRDGGALGVFGRAVNLIQTDATLYGGFTGAGLFGENGSVLGMIVLPALSSETASGVYYACGFALPVQVIAPAAADLIAFGQVKRPRMGIMVQQVDGPDEPVGKWTPCGMIVVDVEKGGPADRAGMLINDIITEVDGVRIRDYNALSAILDSLTEGSSIHVRVYRCMDADGETIDNPDYIEFDLKLEFR